MVELKVAVVLTIVHEDPHGRLQPLRESLIHSMENWGEDKLLFFLNKKEFRQHERRVKFFLMSHQLAPERRAEKLLERLEEKSS